MFKIILKSVGLMSINYHQEILKDAISDSEEEIYNLMLQKLALEKTVIKLEKTVIKLEKVIAKSQSVSKQAVKSKSKYSNHEDYDD